MKTSYYLYIIRCCDDSLYIGISNNIKKRFKKHQSGTASVFTKTHPPDKVVYTEEFGSYSTARHREVQLKKWRRDKKERLIIGLKP